MRFFLDHDVSAQVQWALNHAGHEVILLRDVLPVDAVDSDVMAKAFELGAFLVTSNRNDFLKLFEKRPCHGLLIVIRRNPPGLEGTNVVRCIQRAGEQGLRGNINFA